MAKRLERATERLTARYWADRYLMALESNGEDFEDLAKEVGAEFGDSILEKVMEHWFAVNMSEVIEAGMAQSVQQRTCNAPLGGSNPSPRSNSPVIDWTISKSILDAANISITDGLAEKKKPMQEQTIREMHDHLPEGSC